MNMTESVF